MANRETERSGASAKAVASALTAEDIERAVEMVRRYAKPYANLMPRLEQADHVHEMLRGLVSNLERKSVEPIAVMHRMNRAPLQAFIGVSRWRWEPLRALQREEVARELGEADGAIVFDGSATQKKGTDTVGVTRQYCGRLGKVENGVVGVYAAYLGKSGLGALVDAELFLPEDWVTDAERRRTAFIPDGTSYRTQPQIVMEMLRKLACSPLPFSWVLADDEFGRVRALRDRVGELGRNYVFDVPASTVVRRVKGSGRLGAKHWTVARFARRPRYMQWQRLNVRDGEKGPIEVRAIALPVATERDDRRWVQETLLVIESTADLERRYCLVRAPTNTSLADLVRRAGQRHGIEQLFEEAKGEAGLDHFEVRRWHGWHHHMTLSLIAHWFLVRERRRLGKKRRPGDHGQHDPDGGRRPAIPTGYGLVHGLADSISHHPQRGGTASPLSSPRLDTTAPSLAHVIETPHALQ